MYDLKPTEQAKIVRETHSGAPRNVRVFRACGGVLEHGVVLLHKPVPKVQTHVLQPVHDQADGMKYVFIF